MCCCCYCFEGTPSEKSISQYEAKIDLLYWPIMAFAIKKGIDSKVVIANRFYKHSISVIILYTEENA